MFPSLLEVLSRPFPPAYAPLIERMRFYVEPEISCSRFFGAACFTPESIASYRGSSDARALVPTELGGFVARHLKGGLFVDIPCGLHDVREKETDFALAPLAAALGAAEMWEIDLTAEVVRDRVPRVTDVLDGGYAFARGTGETGMRTEAGIPVATAQDDLLGFIAKFDAEKLSVPKAVYISALQPDAASCADDGFRRTVAAPYLEALYDELARVSRAGDLVILNSSAMLCAGVDEPDRPDMHPALALPPRGFSLMRRCALDKVHVFRKD